LARASASSLPGFGVAPPNPSAGCGCAARTALIASNIPLTSAVREGGIHRRIHLVLEHHGIAHHHGLAAHRRECGPRTQARGRRQPHAIHRDRHFAAAPADLHHPIALQGSLGARDLADRRSIQRSAAAEPQARASPAMTNKVHKERAGMCEIPAFMVSLLPFRSRPRTGSRARSTCLPAAHCRPRRGGHARPP